MAEVQAVPWDVVVIDEAHRLRNVYKKSNKIARAIRDAIGVLLTATPLQNSLMELYGLVTFIDPHIFGSEATFRDLYSTRGDHFTQDQFQSLRLRIQPVCQRTLRRQVTEYIRYTKRISITQDFTPSDAEVRLYNLVGGYLQKPELYALPSSQRKLIHPHPAENSGVVLVRHRRNARHHDGSAGEASSAEMPQPSPPEARSIHEFRQPNLRPIVLRCFPGDGGFGKLHKSLT